MTVRRKIFLYAALLLCLSTLTTCGKSEVTPNDSVTAENSGEPDVSSALEISNEGSMAQPANEPEPIHEEEIVLHRGDWLTSAGLVDQTWVKDYDSTEWEGTTCLYLYAHMPTSDNGIFSDVEDELNHQLYLAGCNFHITIVQCSMDEFMDKSQTIEQLIEKKEEELGITVDLYMTSDYLSAIHNGEILELTDYIEAHEELIEHYDAGVWEQLRNNDGRIYGIPTNPIAVGKLGYAYNPQLASLLSIDMADFFGDPASLEACFPTMLEEGIIPLCLNLDPQDYLMLSLAGLETYGEIFAVRHDGEIWTAIDLWNVDEVTDFYKKLGEWTENGYLSYRESILIQFGLKGTPMDVGQYRYCFLQLQNLNKISWFYDVNMADEGGFLETDFFISDRPAYIYEKMNNDIMVINAKTNHPEECMEFLQLLTLDNNIRLLLYSGIEGLNYMWADNVQIFDPYKGAFSMGLGIDNDLRFWPVEHFSNLYTNQIEAMNTDVRISASLQHPFNPVGMEECYETCRQLIADNALVFLGYYGEDTENRLIRLHELLIEAGYSELIDTINAGR